MGVWLSLCRLKDWCLKNMVVAGGVDETVVGLPGGLGGQYRRLDAR